MLLVQKLIDAIKEGEDGVGTVRWLLEDSGHKFAQFRTQLGSVNFEEVDPSANGFNLICLWATVDGNASLLRLLLSKMKNKSVEEFCRKRELAEICFDFSFRFNHVSCAEVAYFESGNMKIDDMRVHHIQNPLIYATARNMKEMVRFLLKVGANPLVYSGLDTPIEIAKNLKDKDIYFLLKDAAEGSNTLSLKLRMFTREFKWPSL
jgi:hypothetical protein